MFKKLNARLIQSRQNEEVLYEQVLKELERGIRRDGLWAKSLSQADGDDNKARGLYIKYRVQSLEDEIHLENQRLDAVVDETLRKAEIKIKAERARSKQAEKNIQIQQSTKSDVVVPLVILLVPLIFVGIINLLSILGV